MFDLTHIQNPKDTSFIIETGELKDFKESGDWGGPGLYLHLVLNNKKDVYIDYLNLINLYGDIQNKEEK